MFCKTSVLSFIVILLFSCKIKEQQIEQQLIAIDSVKINAFFADKEFDSALFLADKKLVKLKLLNDADNYIKYNQIVVNKLKSYKGNWQSQQKYYLNMFPFYNSLDIDSNSYKIIANAYFDWALLCFQNTDESIDSVILCAENAISMHNKMPALPIRDEHYAYKILGIEYNKLGDPKKSLNYYELESKFIEPKYTDWVATNTINRSIAMKDMGRVDSAIKITYEALALNNIPAIRRADLITILSELQLQKNRHKNARSIIDNAINILKTISIGSSLLEEKKSQALKQRGILERLNNENEASLQTLRQAIVHYKTTGNSNGRDIAKIYIELGKSFDAVAQYDSALKYCQIALQKVIKVDSADFFSMPKKTQLYAENTIIEALDAKAIALEKMYAQNLQQKYLEAAVQCYDIVSIVEKKLLQNFSYDESRLIMLKENRIRSERAIAICYKLLLLTGNNYWGQQGFQFAENNKAFILLESIKRNTQSNSGFQNDTLYEKVQALQTRLSYTDRKLFENNNADNDSSYKVLLNTKNKLNEQLLWANNELKLSSSSYSTFTNKIDTVNVIEKAKTLLNDKTAIVEFFTGDSSNYIFMFTKESGVVFLKAQPSFLPNLKNYVSFFTDKNKINNAPADYQHAAYIFYKEIGIAKNLSSNISSIIVITDGFVNYVPFESLVTVERIDVSPKSFSYLLFTKQISYGYSVATLAAQSTYSALSSNKIICYAPVFANGEQGKQQLLYSINELDAIKATNADGEYFLKNTATLAQFKNTIEKADIIHIATHSNADTSVGMQSSIHFFDSSLYLNEVYNLHLKANLVVLSACETNIGIINKSEGAMSLARGFYYAGARNVETSLWNVNDKSTSILYENFYKEIKQNDFITSLRNAKLKYLLEANTALASPYYWAGFIHIGYNKPKSYPMIFISFILLSNLLVIFLLIRKILFFN